MTATASLFGLAYGDALGRPTEFLTVPEIRARYGPAGPRDLVGEPALVTDDTQMALAVGWALRSAPVPPRPAELEPLLRQRFVEWSVSPENNRAPGNTCLAACRALAAGLPWQRASVARSKGCGANMRVAPVGLVRGYDDDTFAGVAQLQAGLTHGHPTALAAAELTGYAVRILRDGADLTDVPGLLRARCRAQRHTYRGDWLGDLLPPGEITLGWDECLTALDRLDTALAGPPRGDDPCEETGAGWVAEEALATGLLCAIRHRDDPVGALSRAAVTSGDSDSIACLAGAFLGAALGPTAWPASWTTRIEYADQLTTLGRSWD